MGYIRSYLQLAEHIAGGRSKTSRKLQNNTYAEVREQRHDSAGRAIGKPAIAVRLHNTDVLTFHPNDTVTFNAGGWATVITKDRINTYAPDGWKVYSEKGDLYLSYGGWSSPYRYGFFDGITVNLRTGKPLAADIKRAAKVERGNKKRQRERARENATRRREEKRTARIGAGIAQFAAFARAPWVEAAESIIAGLYRAAPEFRTNVFAAESIEEMGNSLRKSFSVARLVEVEVPEDAIDGWHFISRKRTTYYGNLGPIEAGQTWHVPAALKMCAVGLHASPTPAEARGWCPNGTDVVCKVKLWGVVEDGKSLYSSGYGKMVAAYRHVEWMAELPAGTPDHAGPTTFNEFCESLKPIEVKP